MNDENWGLNCDEFKFRRLILEKQHKNKSKYKYPC